MRSEFGHGIANFESLLGDRLRSYPMLGFYAVRFLRRFAQANRKLIEKAALIFSALIKKLFE